MLTRLLIQNFQAHAKLAITLDPAITTVVGPSDVGKSAIIRALRWVCTNQPKGEEFIRLGTKGTTVRLIVDGHTVTRKRGGSGTNEYLLDEQEFKAFKTSVPQPIQDLLNMGAVSWQGQHDPAFWFSATAGEVSRQLNTIVNLGIIDTTLTNVGRVYTKARAMLEASEDSLTQAKAAYDNTAWAEEFDKGLAVVEAAYAHAHTSRERATLARDLAEGVLQHTNARDCAAGAAKMADRAVVAGAKAVKARDKAIAVGSLVVVARNYMEITRKPVPDPAPMGQAIDRYHEAMAELGTITDLVDTIALGEQRLAKAKAALKAAQAAVPNQCPTCGAPTK